MKSKTKRFLARIGVIVLSLVVLILAVRTILNYTSGKKLQAAIKKTQAEGHRLDILAFARNCPEEDNAALIWKAIEQLFTEASNPRGVALNKISEDLFLGRPLSEDSKKQIESAALKNRKIFELIREAAGKPCFQYNTKWSGTPDEIEFPKYVKMLLSFRLFFLSSVLEAQKGSVDQAVDDCATGIRFVSLVLGEPFLLNRLVALSLLRNQLLALNAVLSEKHIAAEKIGAILHLLDSLPLRQTFAVTFNSERAFSLGYYFGLIKENEEVADTPFPFINKGVTWLWKPLFNLEAVYTLKLWDAAAPTIGLPYYETKDARLRFQEPFARTPWYATQGGFLAPDLSVLLIKEVGREADVAVARVGIACEIYRIQKGKFPEGLDQLAPDILKEIPVDPFTGKSLIYKKTERGFIIYSVGPNEKDDGGRGTWMPAQVILEKDDDIVWRLTD
jgi:hypothetical protein